MTAHPDAEGPHGLSPTVGALRNSQDDRSARRGEAARSQPPVGAPRMGRGDCLALTWRGRRALFCILHEST